MKKMENGKWKMENGKFGIVVAVRVIVDSRTKEHTVNCFDAAIPTPSPHTTVIPCRLR
jgi:hypothetical protein